MLDLVSHSSSSAHLFFNKGPKEGRLEYMSTLVASRIKLILFTLVVSAIAAVLVPVMLLFTLVTVLTAADSRGSGGSDTSTYLI